MTLRIDLLRHGETTLGHTLRGSTDDDLTALGWQQMQQAVQITDQDSTFQTLGQKPWDMVFSSSLKRCCLFAEVISKQFNIPLVIDSQLQEMHFGDWEGVVIQQIYENDPELLANFWQQPTQFTPPNAESMQKFSMRIQNALHNIQQYMLQKNVQRALVVTHGGVIKLLKCMATQQPLDDILKMSAELGQLNCFLLDYEIMKLEWLGEKI
ncbi:histidine phosphatase family protein [Acinetobacter sp. P8-3-8]|uniref:histidine phosphatase family protein n=1 Tax=Acinetobacter sp. P8-3-8 TaxID=1029823 RepID=UPI0002485708|nr:histidine phosphatase family protein [Acinetobacter sp. P8-3-8]